MKKNLTFSNPLSQSEFLKRVLDIEKNLYRYVCKIAPVPQDAKDIVQETILALWEFNDRYDPGRPFTPWAISIARNKIKQHAEKAGKFPRILEDEALLDLIDSEEHDEEPTHDDRSQYLQNCLKKLQSDHYHIIHGYYWQKKDIKALSEELKTSIEGIYKWLQRIRHKLENCIRLQEQKGRPSL